MPIPHPVPTRDTRLPNHRTRPPGDRSRPPRALPPLEASTNHAGDGGPMSTPLTHDRRVWTPPAGGFWEGAWQNGERQMPVYDPEDGAIVGTVMDATDAEVRRAVAHVAAGRRRRPGDYLGAIHARAI